MPVIIVRFLVVYWINSSFLVCGVALQQQLSTSHKETSTQKELITDLKAQLSQANSQVADEIKKKDETLNHKVCIIILPLYKSICIYSMHTYTF